MVGGSSLRHPLQSLHYPGQRCPREGFMLAGQSLKAAPVHPLRLVAQAVQYARLPPKPPPDRVRPSQRSIIRALPHLKSRRIPLEVSIFCAYFPVSKVSQSWRYRQERWSSRFAGGPIEASHETFFGESVKGESV